MKKLLLTLLTIVSLQLQAQCWKEVVVGEQHTMAIANNGTLWSWGVGTQNQLGYSTNNFHYTPKQVGNNNDWKKISAGKWYNLIQKNDGTLWTCGIGSGMLIFSTGVKTLYQINTDTDWKSFSCGPHFAILIKNDGTLWGWGDNSFGQAGAGYLGGAESYPKQIGTDTWKCVDAGVMHSVAVKTDGTLWVWGRISINGAFQNILSPIQIGTDTDWEIASAGQDSNAAIKTNGTLWTWGSNGGGQLGIGNQINQENPVQVGTDTWQLIEAGLGDMHGTKTNGSLWGWGYNLFGQIGTGENTPAEPEKILTPVQIFSESGWKAVSSVGHYFTAFINTNGSLKMCGDNGPHLGIGYNPDIFLVATPTTVICSTASLQENTLSTISVYPNPTSGILNLANANDLNIEKLTVIDVTGKTLLEQKSNTSQIDVQQLPVGMYFLEITTNGAKQHTKFIKE